jgi:hypothetical protein
VFTPPHGPGVGVRRRCLETSGVNRTNSNAAEYTVGHRDRTERWPGLAGLGNRFGGHEQMGGQSGAARASREEPFMSRSTIDAVDPPAPRTPDQPIGSPGTWPSGPLDAGQRAFQLLTTPPAPLAFDCRGIADLPQRVVPLDELRRLLISDATTRPIRDAVWREVVTRARRDGSAWVVAAVGLALPGLRRRAGRLASGWHGETADLDAELLTGFLERLTTVDLDAANICSRLIDAGARSVRRARACAEDNDTVRMFEPWGPPPRRPWDHPDWVLARALAAAVLDPEECLLISATRLDDVPIQVVADRLGISTQLAISWRRSGERRLVTAIRAGELDWVSLAPAG